MSEPACECPGPGFCDRYKVRQGPFAHAMCRGDNCTPRRSEAFRLKLRSGPASRPSVSLPTVKAVSRPKRVPLVLRPPCVHQGSEVPGCKTCGGEEASSATATAPTTRPTGASGARAGTRPSGPA